MVGGKLCGSLVFERCSGAAARVGLSVRMCCRYILAVRVICAQKVSPLLRVETTCVQDPRSGQLHSLANVPVEGQSVKREKMSFAAFITNLKIPHSLTNRSMHPHLIYAP